MVSSGFLIAMTKRSAGSTLPPEISEQQHLRVDPHSRTVGVRGSRKLPCSVHVVPQCLAPASPSEGEIARSRQATPVLARSLWRMPRLPHGTPPARNIDAESRRPEAGTPVTHTESERVERGKLICDRRLASRSGE